VTGDGDGGWEGVGCLKRVSHHWLTDSPVEIQIEHLTQISAGAGKGAHLADHGQDGGKGAIVGLERDMQHGARVYDLVDGLEGIVGWGGGLDIYSSPVVRWCMGLTAILQPIDLAEGLGGILEIADRHLESRAGGERGYVARWVGDPG